MSRSVAVVGGGAVGATAAFDLALRDAAVTLYEREEIGSGSTGLAAGICYDAFTDEREAEVSGDAIERFRTFDGEGEFEFHETPYVWLAASGDDERIEAIREGVPEMQQNGRTVLLMEPEDYADRFPMLRSEDVAVAAIAGAAGYGDPAAYARLMSVLATRQGAELRTGVDASVETDPLAVAGEETEEYDTVLVAAGARTGGLVADAGFDLAVKPYRVQALTAASGYEGPIVYDATSGFYMRPHEDGILAGDGTEPVAVDPEAAPSDADEAFLEATMDAAAHRADDIDLELADGWSGLCTATPDQRPVLGELEDGLWVATGFQGHGFMRAPAFGERLANAILGDEDLAGYDPTRFDGDEDFEIREGMALDD